MVPELDYLTEHAKETVVQERKKLPEADRSEETVLLNSDSSSILDELLELSKNYFKIINILSYISRFNYNYGEGIVHVGGRLENASVSYLHKHPAILPNGSKLSKLYFNSLHTRLFPVDPRGLLNAAQQTFWPLSGRSIARKNVHQCVTCFKSRPIISSQIMGNLPSERVEGILISRPLTLLSSDADNFDVWTPGRFLIGRSITSIPEPNLIDVNENRLSRW
ncbi:integrase catalytic domain-containing protein [Trichonephila clavipes]|uniref:Integrase catalytic domain-containing protein n=1 Tax=Trichonephila clavipes TaxID=2585209 RepID=A0A8X6WHZ3_TRICX|nr:integrase catalytic domain-containing protein [Trichonephila clavipes]